MKNIFSFTEKGCGVVEESLDEILVDPMEKFRIAIAMQCKKK